MKLIIEIPDPPFSTDANVTEEEYRVFCEEWFYNKTKDIISAVEDNDAKIIGGLP